jgi:hypothetical protein
MQGIGSPRKEVDGCHIRRHDRDDVALAHIQLKKAKGGCFRAQPHPLVDMRGPVVCMCFTSSTGPWGQRPRAPLFLSPDSLKLDLSMHQSSRAH